MGLTGSIIVYVMIWWIIFLSVLPIGIKSSKSEFQGNLSGNDPGAPKNPNILKKFLLTTFLTTIIFIGIHFMVKAEYLNLREYFK